MADFVEIDAVEAQYLGREGKPTLGRAFELLVDRWNTGQRDRETALRLVFLGWLSCSTGGTGLPGMPSGEYFRELFSFLGGEETDDEEVWFVVGVMTEVAPHCFGGLADESYWTEVG